MFQLPLIQKKIEGGKAVEEKLCHVLIHIFKYIFSGN